jgi:enterochelin esterase family protein
VTEPPACRWRRTTTAFGPTTDVLEPDIYLYTFAIDGVTIADPSNPLVKPIVMGGNQSLVHVPGPATLSWEVNDVPHGQIHEHFYTSKAVGEPRAYYVYTPPGYDPVGAETSRALPAPRDDRRRTRLDDRRPRQRDP